MPLIVSFDREDALRQIAEIVFGADVLESENEQEDQAHSHGDSGNEQEDAQSNVRAVKHDGDAEHECEGETEKKSHDRAK